jgi:hypothetical protein
MLCCIGVLTSEMHLFTVPATVFCVELRVFENKVLRRIFQPKREKIG